MTLSRTQIVCELGVVLMRDDLDELAGDLRDGLEEYGRISLAAADRIAAAG